MNDNYHVIIRMIGVIQMVNKQNGVFTNQDEESFEMFAVYCGLALHHAKVTTSGMFCVQMLYISSTPRQGYY